MKSINQSNIDIDTNRNYILLQTNKQKNHTIIILYYTYYTRKKIRLVLQPKGIFQPLILNLFRPYIKTIFFCGCIMRNKMVSLLKHQETKHIMRVLI